MSMSMAHMITRTETETFKSDNGGVNSTGRPCDTDGHDFQL